MRCVIDTEQAAATLGVTLFGSWRCPKNTGPSGAYAFLFGESRPEAVALLEIDARAVPIRRGWRGAHTNFVLAAKRSIRPPQSAIARPSDRRRWCILGGRSARLGGSPTGSDQEARTEIGYKRRLATEVTDWDISGRTTGLESRCLPSPRSCASF
jgi:hypothetical protein